MRRFITVVLIMALLSLTVGCGQNKTIDGATYVPYGLVDAEENKNPNIQYAPIIENVFWAIVLCETIIVPILIVCFQLYEPIGKKAATMTPEIPEIPDINAGL